MLDTKVGSELAILLSIRSLHSFYARFLLRVVHAAFLLQETGIKAAMNIDGVWCY